ncbi:hypothetical protein JFL55_07120 [Histophilus somni]|uniref:hypothetical protein n=1 Tax=Histophilus somni TaxID=731 RepID=UPI0018EC0BB0|nr:hypothetical protein [Histophilus somni]QQF85561.1 hypothetical protein JFL55_07120 [Histophilus somni]
MGITQQVLLSLFAQCAADVAPETLNAVIDVESSRNPYAIAVVFNKIKPLYIKLIENIKFFDKICTSSIREKT